MPAATGPFIALAGYPGRGIVLWCRDAGEVRWLYFVTGRSATSRARRFDDLGGALAVVPTDPTDVADPLRHYVCARGVDGSARVVIGNGDHVSEIAARLGQGALVAEAAAELEPEPDPPINTPRIAAVVGAPNEVWVIAVVGVGAGGAVDRRVAPVVLGDGEAWVVQTYGGTVDDPAGTAPQYGFSLPVPPPEPGELADLVWSALDIERRVILAEGSAGSPLPSHRLP